MGSSFSNRQWVNCSLFAPIAYSSQESGSFLVKTLLSKVKSSAVCAHRTIHSMNFNCCAAARCFLVGVPTSASNRSKTTSVSTRR